MALPQKQDKIFTLDDIYSLPEGTRAELIDNHIYYMAPPSRIHQRILSDLHALIHHYIKSGNGKCEVYPAPFAVFLNKDDAKHVEPDISVICDPNKLDDKGCHGAPDWIIEIVSPSNSSHDYITKFDKYKVAGVREYWIVDPQNRSIVVCHFESGIFTQQYTFTDIIKVNIYEDLYIDFNELNI